MKIEIVAIGNEILSGKVLETNSNFISKNLIKNGYRTSCVKVVSDDRDVLKKELAESLRKNDIVITTGGIGPTEDDRTKDAVASLYDKEFFYDKKIGEDLKKRGFPEEVVKEQAKVFKGGICLKNDIGSAPGFIIEEKKVLIVLPGVPYEMEKMFLEVLKYLKRKILGKKFYQKIIKICLLSENEIENFLRKLRKKYPFIEIGIYPSLEKVEVIFSSLKKIDLAILEFEKEFKEYIFEEETLQEAVRNIFIEKKKKLAIAESCTGGALASAVTRFEKASEFFLGSIVSYSNDWKKNFLKVSENTLKEMGAVSMETTEEMVKGLFSFTKADYGIAVSGIAGPKGGSKKKSVGTVCISFGKRDKIYSGIIKISKDRRFVINYSVYFSLGLLYLMMKNPEHLSKVYGKFLKKYF